MQRVVGGLVVMAILGLALTACGSSDSDTDSTTASGDSLGQAPTNSGDDDLTGCLIAAGFSQPENFVATVEIDGAERITTVAFPPPYGEDDFLVVYDAGSESEASRLAADFTGGPFAESVASMIYTVAGANDPLSPKQIRDVEACLRS